MLQILSKIRIGNGTLEVTMREWLRKLLVLVVVFGPPSVFVWWAGVSGWMVFWVYVIWGVVCVAWEFYHPINYRDPKDIPFETLT